jgi:putative ABC transport system permease protein
MLLNYIKVALRNLWRHKAYSFINIFGLSIGLATCLLLLLYIFDEISIDKHHQDGDRVYRVYSSSGKGGTWAAGPGPLAAGLKANLPEVEASTRILTFPDIETMLMKHEEAGRQKQFFESNGYYVDSTFFDLFTYRMIYGNAKSALQSPNTIVISNTLARKFFSNVNPVGKALKLTTPFGEFDYTVNAVFDDATNKSHLGANFFLSMRNTDMWNWVINQTRWTTNNIFFTYIKLKKGVDAKVFERKLKPVIERYAGEDMRLAGFSKTFLLQPLEDIYLHSALGNEIASNGNINYLYILGSIAGFILIIACINFMNLARRDLENAPGR